MSGRFFLLLLLTIVFPLIDAYPWPDPKCPDDEACIMAKYGNLKFFPGSYPQPLEQLIRLGFDPSKDSDWSFHYIYQRRRASDVFVTIGPDLSIHFRLSEATPTVVTSYLGKESKCIMTLIRDDEKNAFAEGVCTVTNVKKRPIYDFVLNSRAMVDGHWTPDHEQFKAAVRKLVNTVKKQKPKGGPSDSGPAPAGGDADGDIYKTLAPTPEPESNVLTIALVAGAVGLVIVVVFVVISLYLLKKRKRKRRGHHKRHHKKGKKKRSKGKKGKGDQNSNRLVDGGETSGTQSAVGSTAGGTGTGTAATGSTADYTTGAAGNK